MQHDKPSPPQSARSSSRDKPLLSWLQLCADFFPAAESENRMQSRRSIAPKDARVALHFLQNEVQSLISGSKEPSTSDWAMILELIQTCLRSSLTRETIKCLDLIAEIYPLLVSAGDASMSLIWDSLLSNLAHPSVVVRKRAAGRILMLVKNTSPAHSLVRCIASNLASGKPEVRRGCLSHLPQWVADGVFSDQDLSLIVEAVLHQPGTTVGHTLGRSEQLSLQAIRTSIGDTQFCIILTDLGLSRQSVLSLLRDENMAMKKGSLAENSRAASETRENNVLRGSKKSQTSNHRESEAESSIMLIFNRIVSGNRQDQTAAIEEAFNHIEDSQNTKAVVHQCNKILSILSEALVKSSEDSICSILNLVERVIESSGGCCESSLPTLVPNLFSTFRFTKRSVRMYVSSLLLTLINSVNVSSAVRSVLPLLDVDDISIKDAVLSFLLLAFLTADTSKIEMVMVIEKVALKLLDDSSEVRHVALECAALIASLNHDHHMKLTAAITRIEFLPGGHGVLRAFEWRSSRGSLPFIGEDKQLHFGLSFPVGVRTTLARNPDTEWILRPFKQYAKSEAVKDDLLTTTINSSPRNQDSHNHSTDQQFPTQANRRTEVKSDDPIPPLPIRPSRVDQRRLSVVPSLVTLEMGGQFLHNQVDPDLNTPYSRLERRSSDAAMITGSSSGEVRSAPFPMKPKMVRSMSIKPSNCDELTHAAARSFESLHQQPSVGDLDWTELDPRLNQRSEYNSGAETGTKHDITLASVYHANDGSHWSGGSLPPMSVRGNLTVIDTEFGRSPLHPPHPSPSSLLPPPLSLSSGTLLSPSSPATVDDGWQSSLPKASLGSKAGRRASHGLLMDVDPDSWGSSWPDSTGSTGYIPSLGTSSAGRNNNQTLPPPDNLGLSTSRSEPRSLVQKTYLKSTTARERDSITASRTTIDKAKSQECLSAPSKEVISVRVALALLEKTDWENKCEALTMLGKLMESNQSDVVQNMSTVLLMVDAEVKNLRSQVCRAALNCMQLLFIRLGRSIDIDISLVVQSLLQRCGDTNEFIRQDAEQALVAMVIHVPPIKSVPPLIRIGASHKNSLVRRSCSQVVCELVERLGADQLLGGNRDVGGLIISAMSSFALDASQETRASGRRIILPLQKHPEFDRLVAKHVPQSSMRSLQDIIDRLKTAQEEPGEMTYGLVKSRSHPHLVEPAAAEVKNETGQKSRSEYGRRLPRKGSDKEKTGALTVTLNMMSSNDWKERLNAITALSELCKTDTDLVGQNVVQIADHLTPRLNDNNAKVCSAALLALLDMSNHLGNQLNPVMSMVVQALVRSIASSNTPTYDLAISIVDSLVEHIDPSILVQSFASATQSGNTRTKPEFLVRLADMTPSLSERRMNLVQRHIVPVLWSALADKTKSSVSAMFGSSRMTTSQAVQRLAQALYQALGEELLDLAATQGSGNLSTLKSILDI